MRLIGTFADEQEAYLFCTFLSKREQIPCDYEAFQDSETKKHAVRVWVEHDDDYVRAHAWYERFRENPQEFIISEEAPLTAFPVEADKEMETIPNERKRFRIKVSIKPRQYFGLTLTNILLTVCVLLFLWDGMQQVRIVEEEGPLAVELALTPIEQVMVIDYPCAFGVLEQVLKKLPLKDVKEINELAPNQRKLIDDAEKIPYWKGFYEDLVAWRKQEKETQGSPILFEKIREGEVWRFWSPILMHRGFLHILFNMAWLWILGKQIEERVGKWRMLLLIIISAFVSNVAQYFMSGPLFLGFSGVVVAMAGFIWNRQKVAPWEGYPLQRTTAFFVLLFVIAMFGLELFSFVLEFFTHGKLTANIANTAHIVGGLVGLGLGKLRFFARSEA
jgi:GlpG protein